MDKMVYLSVTVFYCKSVVQWHAVLSAVQRQQWLVYKNILSEVFGGRSALDGSLFMFRVHQWRQEEWTLLR